MIIFPPAVDVAVCFFSIRGLRACRATREKINVFEFGSKLPLHFSMFNYEEGDSATVFKSNPSDRGAGQGKTLRNVSLIFMTGFRYK